MNTIEAVHPKLGSYRLYSEADVSLLFTENETNIALLFPQYPNPSPYVKDGINNFVVHGQHEAVSPAGIGTKSAGHYQISVGSGKKHVLRLRLATASSADTNGNPFGRSFDTTFAECLQEADEFYASVISRSLDIVAANVMRRAIAGMLWSKEFYPYDVDRWLEEHGHYSDAPPWQCHAFSVIEVS